VAIPCFLLLRTGFSLRAIAPAHGGDDSSRFVSVSGRYSSWVDDVRKVYEDRDRYQLLDVREPYEWEAGHIGGAVHIPLSDVMAGPAQSGLDPGKPVIVVCRSGNRSELAALMLQARGYQAENMEGGMEAWAAAGLPFLASDGSPGRVA
jgi:rhodanese-related sulfurtransferase